MTTQPGDTQHGDERQRGGFREAVNELFGRGEHNEADEAREPSAAHDADDPAVVPADGPQSQFRGGQQTTHGDEVRGDQVTPGQVQQGGEPTARGSVQHGGEYRGDPNLPGQGQYGGDTATGVHGDEGGSYRSDPTVTTTTAPTATTATGTSVVRDEHPAPSDEREGADTAAAVGATAAGHPSSTGTASDTGNAPASPATVGVSGAPASPDNLPKAESGERAALVTRDRAESYSSRWDTVKGEFVDEPRRAVADADALVGELLDELQELFKAQRSEIERGLDADETSTEDLRVALRRYRSFFDRLLSI